MNKILVGLTAGLLIAFAATTAPANASKTALDTGGAETVNGSALLPGHPDFSAIGTNFAPSDREVEIALNQIIRIGPRGNGFEKWRCAITLYGNRYYSVGITEGSARARLASYTPQYAYCRRDYRHR